MTSIDIYFILGDVENFIRISKFTHQASTTSSERYLPVLSKIFSEKHIEHDIYFMFEKVASEFMTMISDMSVFRVSFVRSWSICGTGIIHQNVLTVR